MNDEIANGSPNSDAVRGKASAEGSSDTGVTPHRAVGVPWLSRAAHTWALQAQVCNS